MHWGSRIEPVVIFVRKAVYRRMFDFNAIGEAEAMKVLPREMRRAIDEPPGWLEGRA